MIFIISAMAITGIMPLLTAWLFNQLGAYDVGWTVSLVLMLGTLNSFMVWASRSYCSQPMITTKANQDDYLSFFM